MPRGHRTNQKRMLPEHSLAYGLSQPASQGPAGASVRSSFSKRVLGNQGSVSPAGFHPGSR